MPQSVQFDDHRGVIDLPRQIAYFALAGLDDGADQSIIVYPPRK